MTHKVQSLAEFAERIRQAYQPGKKCYVCRKRFQEPTVTLEGNRLLISYEYASHMKETHGVPFRIIVEVFRRYFAGEKPLTEVKHLEA